MFNSRGMLELKLDISPEFHCFKTNCQSSVSRPTAIAKSTKGAIVAFQNPQYGAMVIP
jgi:hypothetical protein